MNNNPVIEIQKQKIEALEEERNNAMRLYEESKQYIFQLEAENNDLKDPLKPHLIKVEMQGKQVGSTKFLIAKITAKFAFSRRKRNMHEQKYN